MGHFVEMPMIVIKTIDSLSKTCARITQEKQFSFQIFMAGLVSKLALFLGDVGAPWIEENMMRKKS